MGEIPVPIAGVGAVLVAAITWLAQYTIAARRVDQVDGPRTASEAWVAVFESTQRQVSELLERIARLEQKLEDRDHELEQAHATIRRLRDALHAANNELAKANLREHIRQPQDVAEPEIAPERRAGSSSPPPEVT